MMTDILRELHIQRRQWAITVHTLKRMVRRQRELGIDPATTLDELRFFKRRHTAVNAAIWRQKMGTTP